MISIHDVYEQLSCILTVRILDRLTTHKFFNKYYIKRQNKSNFINFQGTSFKLKEKLIEQGLSLIK